MKKHAVINSQNVVINIILWDEESLWSPPEGHTIVNVDNVECDINWIYANGSFNKPTEPNAQETTPSKEELFAQLQALQAQIQALE